MLKVHPYLLRRGTRVRLDRPDTVLLSAIMTRSIGTLYLARFIGQGDLATTALKEKGAQFLISKITVL